MILFPNRSNGDYFQSSTRLSKQPYMVKLLKKFGDLAFVFYDLLLTSKGQLPEEEIDSEDYLPSIPNSLEAELCKELYDMIYFISKKDVEAALLKVFLSDYMKSNERSNH